MKKLALALIAVLALIGTTGCLQMHNDVVIEEDGSGSLSFVLGIAQSTAEALQELQALDPNNTDMEMPALDDFDKDEIEKAIKPYDVKLTAFERKTVDGKENISMAFAFKDLKGMSAAMTAVMGGESDGDGLGIFNAEGGNFVLKSHVYDFSDMPMPEKKETKIQNDTPPAQTPEMMQKQMEIMGKLMGSMAELDVRMAITVPGDIIETNAPEQDGRTSIWVINAENMMTAGSDMEPVITFSGKGLKIKNVVE